MISSGTPNAKAGYWGIPDAEVWKDRERSGLDTHVFYPVNDLYYSFGRCIEIDICLSETVNTLNIAPEQYNRKIENQKTRREPVQ